MKIIKIETCYKEHIFWKKTKLEVLDIDSFGVENNLIIIYPDIEYQEIIGFGGAFTEASGFALSQLPKDKYSLALDQYFSKDSLDYSLCRTHINSCDFSLGNYAYLDTPNLSTFSIDRDKKYLIPMIKSALLKVPNLQILASPWSPPAFMKDNNSMNKGGKLLPEYKQLWANYLVKYLDEYENLGISISYMTIQNEPKAVQPWESCIYDANEEADLVRNYIYPTFKIHNKKVKLLIWDHNKERIYSRAKEVFSNIETSKAVCGVAFHWYSGDHFKNLSLVRKFYPDKLLIATEGCTGYSPFNVKDEVKNAEIYAHDYLGNLNAGANGQIDWNLFLDYQGGPNHKQNYCNSPIMINKEHSGFIKNLSYYYIGHFTKFIKPKAKRIANSKYTSSIEVTSFKNIDNSIIIILLNRTDYKIPYTLYMENMIYSEYIKPHSIITYQIRKDEIT